MFLITRRELHRERYDLRDFLLPHYVIITRLPMLRGFAVQTWSSPLGSDSDSGGRRNKAERSAESTSDTNDPTSRTYCTVSPTRTTEQHDTARTPPHVRVYVVLSESNNLALHSDAEVQYAEFKFSNRGVRM